MREKEIRELFCAKISLELNRFKRWILKKEPQEIFNNAYRIDSTINIYERLMEKSEHMKKDEMMILLVFPNLLSFMYSNWIKKDSHQAVFCKHINQGEALYVTRRSRNVIIFAGKCM